MATTTSLTLVQTFLPTARPDEGLGGIGSDLLAGKGIVMNETPSDDSESPSHPNSNSNNNLLALLAVVRMLLSLVTCRPRVFRLPSVSNRT